MTSTHGLARSGSPSFAADPIHEELHAGYRVVALPVPAPVARSAGLLDYSHLQRAPDLDAHGQKLRLGPSSSGPARQAAREPTDREMVAMVAEPTGLCPGVAGYGRTP